MHRKPQPIIIPSITQEKDISDEETPVTPHQYINDLEKTIDQLKQKTKDLNARIIGLEKLQENEKSVRDKLNSCLQNEINFRKKVEQQYQNVLSEVKEKDKVIATTKKQLSDKEIEVENLKKMLASPLDKKNDEFMQFEIAKQKSAADEAKKEMISLTAHYETVMKELSTTKKELQELKRGAGEHKVNLHRPGSTSLFFQETKSYNKGDKPIIIPPTLQI